MLRSDRVISADCYKVNIFTIEILLQNSYCLNEFAVLRIVVGGIFFLSQQFISHTATGYCGAKSIV